MGHTGQIRGCESETFPVYVGVKQGCCNLQPLPGDSNSAYCDAIGIKFRLDTQRLQASTKSSADHIFVLQYADNASLPSHTPHDLQRSLRYLHLAYKRAGLVLNAKKTEVLSRFDSATSSFTMLPNLYLTPPVSLASAVFKRITATSWKTSCLRYFCSSRIKLASSAFGRLSHQVFLNHNLTISPNSTWLDSTRLDTFDFVEPVERVETSVSTDDEQAIVFACTSLVVFMLLHTQILFISSKKLIKLMYTPTN